MKEITIKTFNFDELANAAKEKARAWYRDGFDFGFASENVQDDAKTIGNLLGIDIEKIFYSGFYSQGDGACFEGSFRVCDLKVGEVKKYAPKDKELHRIAKQFETLSKQFPNATFRVKHSGHYYHKYCTTFDFEFVDDTIESMKYDSNSWHKRNAKLSKAENDFTEVARDFMAWIYATLEKEYEYHMADAQVDESIRANEYAFTADGSRTATI